MAEKPKDQFTEKETEDRMRAALKGARVSGHKSMKEISPTNKTAPPKPAKPQR